MPSKADILKNSYKYNIYFSNYSTLLKNVKIFSKRVTNDLKASIKTSKKIIIRTSISESLKRFRNNLNYEGIRISN